MAEIVKDYIIACTIESTYAVTLRKNSYNLKLGSLSNLYENYLPTKIVQS